ncbi:MAG: Crp/Fnr family transcriptional regulator [Cetobacterium somerae]|uniref:HTH crp-type domain-containing protein n=1 Tax=Cetobacterium somerae ATCC BAA-474 TaxID=1319815 RepID=U7UUQ8_9FUSO|nr:MULTISPECIES: Crp/Fnr family transcriptional regulator [Cetobacterium]ERT63152.1 hypothetical protein HMPREF0202_02922 [Cetobacterium somerae ATCC BAA-474]MBC2852369.1 Crp/Fnr family transcriptional regulator [Cetobacterium sp. 2G large]
MTFLEYRKNLIKDILKFNPQRKEYKKGEILTDISFSTEKILIIDKGLIRYYHNLCEEKEFLLGCYSKGNIIILDRISDFLDGDKYLENFYIEVCEDTTCYIVDKNFLKILYMKDIDLHEKILEYTSIFYQKLFFQIRDIKLFSIENAVLSLLIRAYRTYGNNNENSFINHKILNKNIAKSLNSTEETVSRVVAKLKKEGFISIKKKHFFLQNLEEIEKRLGCKSCRKSICYF